MITFTFENFFNISVWSSYWCCYPMIDDFWYFLINKIFKKETLSNILHVSLLGINSYMIYLLLFILFSIIWTQVFPTRALKIEFFQFLDVTQLFKILMSNSLINVFTSINVFYSILKITLFAISERKWYIKIIAHI